MIKVFRGSRSISLTLAVCLTSFANAGCSGDDEPPTGPSEQAVIENYALNVEANYADALDGAVELHAAAHEFAEAPSAATLKTARDAWLASRDPYGLSEAFRFYDGPIDNADNGPEGLINAWPVDESFIDYVVDGEELKSTGIVNLVDEYPEITEDVIAEANEDGGQNETSISTGYHAIEFLLWGQDKSEDGPGDRPFTDYVTGDEGTHENPDRRATYLLTAADLLIENLSTVHESWTEGANLYRADFVAAPSKDSLLKIMTGMASLAGAELAQERMNVAYENQDQEDEHSCFSDNTLADLHNNAKSVQNVLLGVYGDNDGPGLDELIEAKDPALAKAMREQIASAIEEIDAIPAPFDQSILGSDDGEGRTHLKTAIDLLKAFGGNCSKAATALGIELVIE